MGSRLSYISRIIYCMHQSLAGLQGLARQLYDAVNTADIPFANNGSYCHDRAYAMALKAEQAGLPFEMAYFLPGSMDGLQVDGHVPWTAHVVIATPATTINGEPRRLFIDPSLFDGGPVGLQQMQDRLGATLEWECFKFGEFQPKQRPPHQRDDWEPYEYFGAGNRARPTMTKVRKNLRQAQRELRGQGPMPGDVLPAETAKPSDGSLQVVWHKPEPGDSTPASVISKICRAVPSLSFLGRGP
ncbi:MAG: hypothetical protein AAF213_07060 [Pseudomonadota bacterium]